MARPIVYVCTGSDCRARKTPLQKLVAVLEGRAEIAAVPCQKICEGPVCGLSIGGTLEWFGPVDSPKARAALCALLDEGKLKKPLKKLRHKKRRGKLRK